MLNIAPEGSDKKRLHVAVGVILNHSKQILIALRPESSHQGGLWEFPGGKVENDEAVEEALDRELSEELGLRVLSCRPLIEVLHDYPDKSVLLDVWWVDQFSGTPEGKEGQPIRWITVDEMQDYTFPKANEAIVAAVQRSLVMPQSDD